MRMGENSLLKLLIHSKWLQQHEKFRNCCKLSSMFILKIVTGNKGIKKNIGSRGGTFRFDYEFAFSDFQSWGIGHNNAFDTILKVCEGKRVIFDIGAHIGLCSMPVSKVISEDGLVYAFEPAKTNVQHFLRNIEYSGIINIKLFPYLVGEETKENVPFYETHYVTGMNSIVSYKDDDTYKVIDKKQVSLDDFCAHNRIIPEVIKIDVEGAEIEVLKGAKNVLKRYRPIIILSVHPKHLRLLGDSIESLKILITSLGYRILGMDRKVVSDLGLKEYLLEPV